MGRYNLTRLREYRYGILGIYETDLKQLQKGRIPICFEAHARMLSEALPFFPYNERPKYQAILESGLSQVQFLKASQVVNTLKGAEQSRKKVIDDFLVGV